MPRAPSLRGRPSRRGTSGPRPAVLGDPGAQHRQDLCEHRRRRPGRALPPGRKAIAICERAWAVVHRLHPDLFDRATPNPWVGVTVKRRTVTAKEAVSRDDVYTFAWGVIDVGEPEVAAAAVICFEWVQRPENVLAGYIRWPTTGDRPRRTPSASCTTRPAQPSCILSRNRRASWAPLPPSSMRKPRPCWQSCRAAACR